MSIWERGGRRGRWWLSYDLRSIVLPRIVWMCDGDYRAHERRTLEVGLALRAGYSEPVVSVVVDLVDHPLERPIAASYWAVVEGWRWMRRRPPDTITDGFCHLMRAADALRRWLT